MPIDVQAALHRKVIAVLNIGSGGCDAQSSQRVEAIFQSADLPAAEVIAVAPEEIDAALRDAAARADVVVVLGGDGTIRTAATRCGEAGRLLVPLPGGTMNMLPKGLYGDLAWDKVLTDVLAAPEIRDVSGGQANGQAFFCAAVLGAPSLWADAREAVRKGHPVEAVQKSVTAIRRSSESLDYCIGDQPRISTEAVVVICPLIAKDMNAEDRSLEVAALEPMAAGGMFGLAFRAVFDDWRNDPSVTLAKVKSVRVYGHGRVPVILDGEKAIMGRSVTVTFTPLAFRAIVPAGVAAKA